MKTEALAETQAARKVVFHRVAENLYRLETSGGYYALVKRGDKQFRRSLRTKDRKLAERRLTEYRSEVGNLRITEDAFLSFEDIAKRWMAVTSHTLKASSALRREQCIKQLLPYFAGLAIRNIQRQHCERWLTERGPQLAAMSMNRELELMRGVFGYAVKLGLMLKNPAEDLERRRVVQAQMQIPTRDQFKQLVAAIRASDGRADSIRKAQPGADLVELLAFSGGRLSEATSIRWRDVDFAKATVTVTGGEEGTKNHEQRTIPMTARRAHTPEAKRSRALGPRSRQNGSGGFTQKSLDFPNGKKRTPRCARRSQQVPLREAVDHYGTDPEGVSSFFPCEREFGVRSACLVWSVVHPASVAALAALNYFAELLR